MAEKRGLFQSIFGKKQQSDKDFHAYKLLSSWESTFSPYSGNMWDINTVRSAVDAFARRASTAQPRHVRQSQETTVSVNDYVDRILQYQPNPYMTAADFYYKLAAQYKVYNNAVAYYCHAYCSCERGTNENINRMIRRRFPKGTDFEAVTDADVARVEDWINNYPREILGFQSSAQMFSAAFAAAA